jgi:hypothetical protein
MKTPHLLASFAVAATAAAADLKDPAQVAREFNEAAQTTLPMAGPADLRALSAIADKPLTRPDGFFSASSRPKRKSHVPWGPIPRDKIYDAPNYSVPEVLPDNMPPGSKVWRYGGQDYYLIPLIPSREK